MKLIIAIAHERDKNKLTEALLSNGLTFTRLGSTGGFLRQGNVTLLIGVEDDEVERVVELLREAGGSTEQFVNVPGEAAVLTAAAGAFPPNPVAVKAGGAVVFVVNVEGFHRL
jgi:uncharacterized protein YaaQ